MLILYALVSLGLGKCNIYLRRTKSFRILGRFFELGGVSKLNFILINQTCRPLGEIFNISDINIRYCELLLKHLSEGRGAILFV